MVSGAPADEGNPGSSQTNLVKQANAPISSILQIRLQDGYAPEFTDLHGRGNVFTIARNASGVFSRTCTVVGKGSCPASGSW